MASSKEYLDFILEQLSDLDDVRSRAMMGEYILYYRGKVFGGVYDDRLLVKPVPTALQMMPDAEMELPYDGAKEMILVDDVDNRQFLCKLVKCMHLRVVGFLYLWYNEERIVFLMGTVHRSNESCRIRQHKIERSNS